MATKPDFSVQLSDARAPVSADPSATMRSIELSAKATGEALKVLGSTAYEAYTSYQTEGLKQGLTSGMEGLQKELDIVKQGDIANKARLEQGRATLSAEQEGFRAAALLSGADEEEARKNASIFAQQKEPAILATYRTEQTRLAALRDQMPEKQHEAMLRSEAMLKNYIARFPGLANSFRAVSQEVTGQKNLDMYSVQQLYKDIDFIEKQKEQTAKNIAAAEEKSLGAFVKDMTTGGRMGETEARALYSQLPAQQRLNLANAQVRNEMLAKDAEAELKKGGAGIQNFVTGRISLFNSRTVAANADIYTELKKLGITNEMIYSGSIPADLRYSPPVKKLMEQGTQNLLTLLDSEYIQTQSELRAKLASPTDAAAARESLKDLDGWYAKSKESIAKGGIGASLANLSSSDDPKVMAERNAFIKTFTDSLQIHPDVAKNLSLESTKKQTALEYPAHARDLDFLDKMRTAALRGVSAQEWTQLQKDFADIRSGKNTPPKTPSQSAASLVNYKDAARTLEDAANGTGDPGKAVQDFMQGALATENNSRESLTKYTTALTTAVGKVPTSEQEAVKGQVKSIFNSYIYDAQGHGNAAKQAYNTFVDTVNKREAIPYSSGKTITFSDISGTKALSIKLLAIPDPNIANDPAKLGEFTRNANKFSRPDDVNSRLATIDNTIRLRAMATGESVVTLRKEFMDVFMKEGMPSANATSILGTTNAPPTTTPTTPAVPVPATGGALVTPQMRATDDVKALQAELKRIQTKPSWITEGAWNEQKRILESELVKAQAAAK